MKIKNILVFVALNSAILTGYAQSVASPTLTAQDSLSYALGIDIARSLKSSGFELSLPVLQDALAASYHGNPLKFDESIGSTVIQKNFQELREKRNAALREPGETYLANLKANPNVQATPEGVLYEILTPGTGAKPQKSDEVKVLYAGYLIDGTKFDSSYDRGEPIVLQLNRVIAGWTIGLPLMSVGSKYKLYIPYHLGYGEGGSGKIPPFSTLIFEIELLEILTPNATS